MGKTPSKSPDVVLVIESKPKGAVAKSSDVWNSFSVYNQGDHWRVSLLEWSCLLKMSLLILGLSRGFTISYPDPLAPIKALLSVDGCQIVVVEWRGEGKHLIHHLADVSSQIHKLKS